MLVSNGGGAVMGRQPVPGAGLTPPPGSLTRIRQDSSSKGTLCAAVLTMISAGILRCSARSPGAVRNALIFVGPYCVFLIRINLFQTLYLIHLKAIWC